MVQSTIENAVRCPEAVLPRPEQRRLDFIDALRGFACLWVLLHHSFEHLPLSSDPLHLPLNLLILFSRVGWLGVSLFLVLSGFCLYYPLVRRNGPAGVALKAGEFARRRARRILPPYMAALALFTLMAWFARSNSLPWPETVGWKDVISHALMLHNLRPSTFASINPAFWSLALEVQLYMVFPLLVWIAARFGCRTLALTTFGIALLWQGAAFFRHGLSLNWAADFATMYHALPARCFEFALGMMAAAAVAAPHPRHQRYALALILLLTLPALWFVLTISRFAPLLDPAWGLVFASGVILLSRVSERHFRNLFLLRSIVWLGAVSYSVYLIHQPLIWLLAPEYFGFEISGRGALILFGMVKLVAIIGMGAVFFAMLEKPCIARPQNSRRPALAG